jgi:glycosyltransferase involved in cell wall biosynthesis
VVPHGCDPTTFQDADPRPFIEKYGVRDFVLQVGPIQPAKNQLLLVYALRDQGLPMVLIGGNQQPYLEWCRQHGPKDLLIIPHLRTRELRSAYAAAHVHALPGWIETCGPATMAASLADCNVVVSTAGCELEYYRDLAYYCDPSDVDSIRVAVVEAYRNHACDGPQRRRLKELILQEARKRDRRTEFIPFPATNGMNSVLRSLSWGGSQAGKGTTLAENWPWTQTTSTSVRSTRLNSWSEKGKKSRKGACGR